MCLCICSACKLSISLVLLIWKIINSLFGLAVIFHSIWLLISWFLHVLPPTPPHVFPAPNNGNYLLVSVEQTATSDKWTGPWCIYGLLVIGVIGCSITLLIHIATKNTSSHCTVYVVAIILIILETLMVVEILFDHRWKKEIPTNAGTVFEGARQSTEHNVKICRWFGLGWVAMQVHAFPLLYFTRTEAKFERNVHNFAPLLIKDSMDTEAFSSHSVLSSKVSMDPNDSKILCESV